MIMHGRSTGCSTCVSGLRSTMTTCSAHNAEDAEVVLEVSLLPSTVDIRAAERYAASGGVSLVRKLSPWQSTCR
jgi:hypothetical protein